MEPLRADGELSDGEPRAFAAARAVAPLAMEAEVEGVVLESVDGERREAGVALAGAAVAMPLATRRWTTRATLAVRFETLSMALGGEGVGEER